MPTPRHPILDDFPRRHGSPEIARFVDLNLTITERVYALMKAKGWGRQELAEAMGYQSNHKTSTT